jgi:hypothetical protein
MVRGETRECALCGERRGGAFAVMGRVGAWGVSDDGAPAHDGAPTDDRALCSMCCATVMADTYYEMTWVHLFWDGGPRYRQPKIPPETRRRVFGRDGNTCVYCGTSEDLTLDHVDPGLRQSTEDNLVVACRACNARKGDRTPKKAGMRVRRSRRSPGTQDGR